MRAAHSTSDEAGDENGTPRCPACGADASYHYGRTWNGKSRRICLICNRQYVSRMDRPQGAPRPACPACAKPMHVYQRRAAFVRYRCRDYPECRHYVKVATVGTETAHDGTPDA